MKDIVHVEGLLKAYDTTIAVDDIKTFPYYYQKAKGNR